MCGLAGIFDSSLNPVDERLATAMGQTLRHRGPDNFSVFATGNVALAHNRLSILDLSASGNQPFTDNRYALVYNGEIYNYLELKERLKDHHVQFRSTSDTEVLFHHLVQFGIARTMVALKGMYAFAFFDRVTRTLILARDRLGIKPLYWHRSGSRIYFASEIKAIASVTPLTVDPLQTLFSLTGGAESERPSSMFRQVKAVRPGSFLTLTPDTAPVESTYYTLYDQIERSYVEQLRRMSREEVNEQFAELLDRSVRSMLMSDAPMGVFVSGGIDSSLAAALACKYQPLDLFTSDVKGEYSELKDAELLARSLNAPLHVSTFDRQAFLRDLAEGTYHYECPVVSFTNAVAFMGVAKLARAHSVKAVLTGEGSDELFHGYPHLLTRHFDSLVQFPLNFVKSLYSLSPRLASYVKVGSEMAQSEFLRMLVKNFPLGLEKQKFVEEFGFMNGEQEEYFTTIGLCETHLYGLLHRNDRMGMVASIESRFPFLDEDIVKFGINLPPEMKRRITWRLHNYKHPFIVDKAPVRDSALRLLPPPLVQKKKWGFSVLAHQVLRVRPGFFSEGFVGEMCGLTRQAEAHLIEKMPRYYVGKLVSIEVFGRLFDRNEKIDAVADALYQFVSADAAAPASVTADPKKALTVTPSL